IAVAAGRHAAHVNDGKARRDGLEANRRQLLRIFLEVRNVQLIETAGADRLDADRNVLEIFLALRRGDDDLALIRLSPSCRLGSVARNGLLAGSLRLGVCEGR